MEEIKNEEIVEVQPEGEVIELDDLVEDRESYSLGESLAAIAILAAPLVGSYVLGVVSSDGVKNGIANFKEKISKSAEKRKAKIASLKEAKKSKIEDANYEEVED